MKSKNDQANQKYLRMKAEQDKLLKQKQDVFKGVLNTIISKPKFIKLIDYALNSLDSYITPPNRDIRINSKIIIKEEGIKCLKVVSTCNIDNEEILTKVGIIISKLIGEPVDREVAMLFIENAGHDLIIEIVLSKAPGINSLHYVKIMNSLIQIRHILPKLIDSGIVESIKLINDLYFDYPEIVSLNMETMKKVSNFGQGREALIKKKLVLNILKSAEQNCEEGNEATVITSLSVVDNISKTEQGLEELRDPKVIRSLDSIIDRVDLTVGIEQLCAKIYSKLKSEDDLIAELNNLNSFNQSSTQFLYEMETALRRLTHIMIIDESDKLLNQNLEKYILFVDVLNNQLLKCSDLEAIKLILTCFKLLAKIFKRIVSKFELNQLRNKFSLNFLQKFAGFLDSVCNSVCKSADLKLLFSDCFCLASHSIYLILLSHKGDSSTQLVAYARTLELNLKIIKDSFDEIEQSTGYYLIASKFIFLSTELRKVAINESEINLDTKTLALNPASLHHVFKKGIYFTMNGPTISNFLESVIFSVSYIQESKLQIVLDFAQAVLHCIVEKYYKRDVVQPCLHFLEKIIEIPQALESIQVSIITEGSKLFGMSLTNSIIISMTKHKFESLNLLTYINVDKNFNPELAKLEDSTEEKIMLSGSRVLDRCIKDTQVKQETLKLKEIAFNFNPEKYSFETISNLDNLLHSFMAYSWSRHLLQLIYKDVSEDIRSLIRKDIIFSEKLFKNPTKSEELNSSIKSSMKRLYLLIGLILAMDKGLRDSVEETSNNESLLVIKTEIKCNFDLVLELIEKSLEPKILMNLILESKEGFDFILDNLADLNDIAEIEKEESSKKRFTNIQFESSLVEKLINSLISLLRKNIDFPQLNQLALETLDEIAEKCPEMINFIVKSGCPKLILQFFEKNAQHEVIITALKLLHKICLSSNENLVLLTSLDTFSKICELDSGVEFGFSELIAPILEKINSIPVQKDKLKQTLDSSIKDICDVSCEAKDYAQTISICIGSLNRINMICSNDALNSPQIKYICEDVPDFWDKLLKILPYLLTSRDYEINQRDLLIENFISLETVLYQYHSTIKELGDIQIYNTVKLNILIPILILGIENTQNANSLQKSCNLMNKFFYNKKEICGSIIEHTVKDEFAVKLLDLNEIYSENYDVCREIHKLISNLCQASSRLTEAFLGRKGVKLLLDEIQYASKVDRKNLKDQLVSHLKIIKSMIAEPQSLKELLKFGGIQVLEGLIFEAFQSCQKVQTIHVDIQNYLVLTSPNERRKNKFNLPETRHICICLETLSSLIMHGEQVNQDLLKWCIAIGLHNFPDIKIFQIVVETIFVIVNKSKLKLTQPEIQNLTQLIISGLEEFSLLGQTRIYRISESGPIGTTVSTVMNFAPMMLGGVNVPRVENAKLLLTSIDSIRCASILSIYSELEELENLNTIMQLACSKDLKKHLTDPKQLLRLLLFLKCGFQCNIYNIQGRFSKIEKSVEAFINYVYENLTTMVATAHSFEAYISVLNSTCNILKVSPNILINEETCIFKLIQYSGTWMSPINLVFMASSASIILNLVNQTNHELISEYANETLFEALFNLARDYLEHFENLLKENKEWMIDESLHLQIAEFSKESIVKFWRYEGSNDIKKVSLGKLISTLVSILRYEAITQQMKYLVWEAIKVILASDFSIMILNQEEFSNSMISIISAELDMNDSPDLFQNCLLDCLIDMSSKATNQSSVIGSLVDVVSKQIVKYKSQPSLQLSKMIEAIKNLTELVIVQKVVTKNIRLMKLFTDILSKINTFNSVDQLNAAKTLNFLLGNKPNNEWLIGQIPELYTAFIEILTLPINFEDPNLEEANTLNENTFSEVLNGEGTYQLICKSGLLPAQKLSKIFENHQESKVIVNLFNNLNNISQPQIKEGNDNTLNYISEVCLNIKGIFDRNIDNLIELSRTGIIDQTYLHFFFQTSGGKRTSLSDIPMFPPEFEENTAKDLAQELCVRTNPNIPIWTQDLLDLSLSQYSFLVDESQKTEEGLKTLACKEIEKSIHDIFTALRELAHHPANHQSIFQLGLLDLSQKIISDTNISIKKLFLVEVYECITLCSSTENGMRALTGHSLASTLVEHFLDLGVLGVDINYSKQLPIKISNLTSNFASSRLGFKYMLSKVSLERLIQITTHTVNISILASLQTAILGFMESQDENCFVFMSEISEINIKCATHPKRSFKMLSDSIRISALLIKYSNEKREKIMSLLELGPADFDVKVEMIRKSQSKLFPLASAEFSKFNESMQSFNYVLTFIAEITTEKGAAQQALQSDLILKVFGTFTEKLSGSKDPTCKLKRESSLIGIDRRSTLLIQLFEENIFKHHSICEYYLKILWNFINLDNSSVKLLTSKRIYEHIIEVIKCNIDEEQSDILQYSLRIIQKTLNFPDALKSLNLESLSLLNIIIKVLRDKPCEYEIVISTLTILTSYIKYKDVNLTEAENQLDVLIQILIDLQRVYYTKSAILLSVTILADLLIIKVANDKVARQKLFKLIHLTLTIQDWDTNLVSSTLTLIQNHVVLKHYLLEELSEERLITLVGLICTHYSNSEIIIKDLALLIKIAENPVYCSVMFSNGIANNLIVLMSQLSRESCYYPDEKHMIEDLIFSLLSKSVKDKFCSERIAYQLMDNLLLYFSHPSFRNHKAVREIMINVIKNPKAIEPFIYHDGVKSILTNLLSDMIDNIGLIDALKILQIISEASTTYRDEFMNSSIIGILENLLQTRGKADQKIEFEINSSLFIFKKIQVQLNEIPKIQSQEVQLHSGLKQEIRNYLVSGRIVKIIKPNGEVKSMHLMVSSDLLKIWAKKPKMLSEPAKAKYTIDTSFIKQIVKGHATDAFKKSKGFFRSIPKPEICFSIIGKTTIDGERVLNAECENEFEIDKWISYLEAMILYLRKSRLIRTNVLVTKMSDPQMASK